MCSQQITWTEQTGDETKAAGAPRGAGTPRVGFYSGSFTEVGA